MTEQKDTIIVVAVTRKDEFGNMWVTPKGDGEEIKIAAKRSQLHKLFEQGKAVLLHWETYMNKPYVSGAKLVEGELPEPVATGELLPEHKAIIGKKPRDYQDGQAIGRCWNDIRELIIHEKLSQVFGETTAVKILKAYQIQILSTLDVPYEDKELKAFKVKKEEA